MKKYASFLLLCVCVLSLAGCKNQQEQKTMEITAEKNYFEAEVLEVLENSLFVEPSEGSMEKNTCSQIVVSTGKITEEKTLEYLAAAETGDTVSIGYLGEIAESDPAQIKNAEEIKLIRKAEENPDKIPMVRIKGKLYRDTGKESTITGRCGVMDGEITSTVDRTEIPTEDDQSNFGSGYSYQYGSKKTIEVYINNKWCVFEEQIPDDSAE